MFSGTHHAEFTLVDEGGQQNWDNTGAHLGVVRAGFNVDGSGSHAGDSQQGWMFPTRLGELLHAGRCSKWKGQPKRYSLHEGCIVGLLLDLDQQTLSVSLNGSWLGVMVAPGMRDWRGEAVAALEGPLCWAVDVGYDTAVQIKHAKIPERIPLTPHRQ